MVDGIKQVSAELQRDALGQLEGFEDRGVDLALAVGKQGVEARRAVSERLEVIDVSGGVVPALRSALAGAEVAVFDAVRAVALAVVEEADRRADVEARAAAEEDEPGVLPASDELIEPDRNPGGERAPAAEWQLDVQQGVEDVGDVLLRRAPILIEVGGVVMGGADFFLEVLRKRRVLQGAITLKG